MMTIQDFKERKRILVTRGYSEKDALHIAELIGDKIEVKDGMWVVRDESGGVVGMVEPLLHKRKKSNLTVTIQFRDGLKLPSRAGKVTSAFTLSPFRKIQGRRSKLLDADRIGRLEKALIEWSTIRNACVMAGISDKTFYRWIKEAELAPEGHELWEFRDTVKKAMAIAEDQAIKMIQNAGVKDWRAAAWFLERRFRQAWGRKHRF